VKGSNAANLALFLAAFSFVLLFCGFFARYSWVSPRQVPTAQLISHILLVVGVFAYSVALWLSGFALSVAPRRSLAAAFLCLAPLIFLWYLYESAP